MDGFDKEKYDRHVRTRLSCGGVLIDKRNGMAFNLVASSQSLKEAQGKLREYDKADGLVEKQQLQYEFSWMAIEPGEVSMELLFGCVRP